MEIRNIIFDLGGVLLQIDYRLTEKAFTELGCKDFNAIYSKAKQTPLFDDFETGKISEAGFFNELKIISGLHTASDFDLRNAWNAMLINFPTRHYILLNELRKKYKLFLLSNTNETHINGFTGIIEKSCGFSAFEDLFGRSYYSSVLGLRKPDAACFLHVLNENNLQAEETVFIDDSIQHVEGALKTGIKAHWLEEPMQTEKLLKELNLF